MATLEQALAARVQNAEALARLGAHAVLVERGGAAGDAGWVVLALTDTAGPLPLRSFLQARTGSQTVSVPLVVRVGEPFAPQ